jgi:hypothetical protein
MRQLIKIPVALAIIVSGFSFQKSSAQEINKPSVSARLGNIETNNFNVVGFTGMNRGLIQCKIEARVAIINNASKTIEYLCWLCDWQQIFTTDTNLFAIGHNICNKEGIKIDTIHSHDSVIYRIDLYSSRNAIQLKGLKFRLGVYFAPPLANSGEDTFSKELEEIESKENIIWSNTIEIK